ncbi:adenosine deaminase [Clostridium sp. D2Q-14]|uniref:adenosine deaminase n=1 Tax=Anaeromonas gelatinilytica TaxID=2683194 RepID=UPI00193AE552|nr:adenosine deaminase [Anaeromonas gelatinilytica]MBS4534726.1 adenosine deaminase [Anaeromonas gelatinilytica]
MNVQKKIERFPKIDLHCHLDGSVRPETILEIALKEDIHVPTTKIEAFKQHTQVAEDCSSLKEYLSKFALTSDVMQKSEYIYRITDELLEDLSNENVKYIEIRFAPFLHMEKGMTFEEAVESVLKAMEEGKEKYGILSKLILICMRRHSPEVSVQIVEKGKAYLGKGVVAIDLAGNEHDFPPELHKKAFQLAKEYGFHRTVHAGETGIPKNIITAVEELKAERIGHGIHAYLNEEILEFVKEKKIPLEMCISSNVQTKAVEGFEDHPIKKYLDEGIAVTINTDNITVSNTTLAKEYEILMNKQGFTLEDIKQTIINGINASFASNEEKEELTGIFKEEFFKL